MAGIRDLVRRNPFITFVVLSYLLSWWPALTPAMSENEGTSEGSSRVLMSSDAERTSAGRMAMSWTRPPAQIADANV